MQLYSLEFVLFVLILLLIYYTVGKERQWICLLIGSLAFYAAFGPAHLIYILLTSFSIYLAGRGMGILAEEHERKRKAPGISREEKKELKKKLLHKKGAVLAAALILNLGVLGYFKYWNPFLESLAGFLHLDVTAFSLYRAGGILLPLGISFYTFQAVGYLIDVYRDKYEPERSFFRFLLFVSFFPQLLQGPINRFDELKEQLYARHLPDTEGWKRALLLILFGAMKKYAAADLLSGTVGYLFDHEVGNLSSPVIVTGILMYSAQQYCDFSGGIDMVTGVAELFGIRMTANFRQPYFAVSLADFWRRWHISLGGFMRDYVFYPFALTRPMQRFGRWCQTRLSKQAGRVLPAAISNILVFYLVGIWHGAEAHYVIWGLYNGVVIAASDLLKPVFSRLNSLLHIRTESRAFHVFRILRTFFIVNIGWYFDRIADIDSCIKALRNTLLHPDWSFSTVRALFSVRFSGTSSVLPFIALAALILVFINSLLIESGRDVYALLHTWGYVRRWGLYLFMLLLILASFAYANGQGGFLYANF